MKPIYVDVDGTLIKTDLLFEGIIMLLKSSWIALFLLPWWLLRGKAYLKNQIARRVSINPTLLPYNGALLDYLKLQASSGHKIYLASASHTAFVQPIAEHLGFINGWLASDSECNLKGKQKAGRILQEVNGEAFIYAGNAAADIPVWKHSAEAIVVNAPRMVEKAVKKTGQPMHVFKERRRLMMYLREMRIHQAIKNLLLFVPAFTSNMYTHIQAMSALLVLFCAFVMTTSGIYIINDLLDLNSDRQHRTKRFRPLASGEMPIGHAFALIFILLCAGQIVAGLVSGYAALVLLLYALITLAYSLYLKTVIIVDVIVLAFLYTIRVIAGAVAIHVYLSVWLLAFSIFIFLSLALVKRSTELAMVADNGLTSTSGRDYRVSDLPFLQSMGISSAYVAVLVIALYLESPNASRQYQTPEALWLICPLLLYWVSRLWIKTARREMTDDPIIYTLKDRTSWYAFIGMFLAWSLAHIGLKL